ncbi:MAG: ceramidase domain-containing protein [Pseudomonadota bacterium]
MGQEAWAANLVRRIDGYCERVSEAFWAEPVNAVTNMAFLIAAAIAFDYAKRRGRIDFAVGFLLINLTVIGIGSFLFHTFATVWAAMTDTIPIMIFIIAYFAAAMRYFVGLSRLGTTVAVVILLFALPATSAALRPILLPLIGGSVSYVPALLMLLGVGAYLWRAGNAAGPNLVAGGALFAVSLTFRALDQPVCMEFPTGTHFAWHICNGTLLGFLIYTLVRHRRDTEPSAPPAAA